MTWGPPTPARNWDVYVADLMSGADHPGQREQRWPGWQRRSTAASPWPAAPTATGCSSQAYGNNFGPADEGIDGDLYLRDFTAGTTTLVSVNASGTDGANASADYGWMDASGTKVVFGSSAQ